MSDGTVLAWHFTGRKLRDGSQIPAQGEWLVHDGRVKMCSSGLHASRKVIDALAYAPEQTLHRVRLRGIADEEDDKLVANERKIIWTIDGDTMDGILREFSRWCALQVIHLWDAPDVVVQYLKTGDESIRDAARDAAWAAARAAARAAAWDAAWDVAWASASDAAWASALDKSNRRLTSMVMAEKKRLGL